MPPTSASPPPHAPAQPDVPAPAPAQTPAQALWRMREYMRPYYFALALMISAAILAVSSEVAIPLITKSVIDNVVVQRIKSKLVPLSIAAMALGTSKAALNFFRRWSVSGAVTGMEKTVRDDLYYH